MADLPLNEFLARIGEAPNAVSEPVPETLAGAPEGPGPFEMTPGSENAVELIPATQRELDKAGEGMALARGARPQVVAPSRFATPDMARKLGARAGVPFDTQTGIPFMTRLRAEAQPTKEEEIKALEAAYGPGKVRTNSFGDLIVTKPREDGKETDFLVDPIGLDWGDAASVLAQLPEMAGAILATARTRGANLAPGVWNAAKTLVRMVGGAAAGGAAKDVAVRGLEGEPVQPGEIATRRGEEAAVNLGVGAALGTGAKAAGMLFSPFSNTGKLQFDAKAARDRLAEKYGVTLSMTPAEATGNSFLQRAEAMESQKPGASVPFEKMMKQREAQLTQLQQLALGGGAPDEELAGQRALAALGAKTAPLTQDVERAAAEAVSAAESELKAGVGAPVRKEVVGEAVKQGAIAEKAAFDAVNEANYGAFFNNPLAREPVIEGKGLKSEIDSMITDLPKVRKQVQRPTGVLGPNGQPLMETVERDVPVDTPVRARLEELSGKLAGGKVSINDLKQIRTDVDNAIKTGEAVPGVKEGRLKSLYAKLTGAIEQGLDEIGDPNLTAAWQKATSYYKANVGRFEKAGIAELFRDPINALGPHEMVDRAISSPDVYNAYKEFFGAGSVQVRGVQQAIRDETLGLSDLSPSVSAAAFVRRLEAMPKDVRADVFGVSAGKLRSAAQALRAAGGETLPGAEMQAMLASGNVSAAKVTQMLSAQAVKDQAYRNEIVRAVSEGNFKPDRIKPTEFVNKMVFSKGTQPQDVQEVVAMLQDRPDVLEDMRRLAFQRALDDATVVNAATGKRTVVANDLEEMLADSSTAKRLEAVLGPSTFEDLKLLKDFLKPGAVIQQAAKSAGGLSTGQQVAGLVERGALKYVDRAIKNFFIATVYTSPPIKAMITNTVLEERGKAALVNYVISSTPFLEAVAKVPGGGAQRRIVRELKGSIDRVVQEDPAQGAVDARPRAGDIPWDQFLRRIGATNAPVQP